MPARQIRELVKNAEGKLTETPDIIIGRQKLKAELIPPALIVARFFAEEQAALEALETQAEEFGRALEEMDEEQGGEDGLLFEAKTEKGKLTAKSVKDRVKDIKGDKTAVEERSALTTCLKLIEQEKEVADVAKDAKTALDTKTVKHYVKLTDAEIKLLVVEDKWLATLQADVGGRARSRQSGADWPREAVDRALCRALTSTGAKCGGAASEGRCPPQADGLRMELRAGYKQTEVGVIPEDWDVNSIRELVDRVRLGGNYPNSERETSRPLIKMGNMGRGSISTTKMEYIPEGLPVDEQHRLKSGDVIFNTRNTLDLVGKVCIWRDELPAAYYNSNVLRLEFSRSKISSSYFCQLCVEFSQICPSASRNCNRNNQRCSHLHKGFSGLSNCYTTGRGARRYCRCVKRCGCVDCLVGCADRQEAQPQTGRHAATPHRENPPAGVHCIDQIHSKRIWPCYPMIGIFFLCRTL